MLLSGLHSKLVASLVLSVVGVMICLSAHVLHPLSVETILQSHERLVRSCDVHNMSVRVVYGVYALYMVCVVVLDAHTLHADQTKRRHCSTRVRSAAQRRIFGSCAILISLFLSIGIFFLNSDAVDRFAGLGIGFFVFALALFTITLLPELFSALRARRSSSTSGDSRRDTEPEADRTSGMRGEGSAGDVMLGRQLATKDLGAPSLQVTTFTSRQDGLSSLEQADPRDQQERSNGDPSRSESLPSLDTSVAGLERAATVATVTDARMAATESTRDPQRNQPVQIEIVISSPKMPEAGVAAAPGERRSHQEHRHQQQQQLSRNHGDHNATEHLTVFFSALQRDDDASASEEGRSAADSTFYLGEAKTDRGASCDAGTTGEDSGSESDGNYDSDASQASSDCSSRSATLPSYQPQAPLHSTQTSRL